MKSIEQIIDNALYEDAPEGDVTAEALFEHETSEAVIFAKQDGVVSGIAVARMVFERVDKRVMFKAIQSDGARVEKDDVIAILKGKTRALLKGERTALNFMARMSGIASATRLYVDAIEGTHAKIYDTRKTVPNLRVLDKLAVSHGGGTNHRMSLSDMALIKDNHVYAAGGVKEAVQRVKETVPSEILVQVEVETFEQCEEALKTDCDSIMLDNMNVDMMRRCVKASAGLKPLEASGNITLNNVLEVARTGVERISVGAITHSVIAFDLSMRFSHKDVT